ncbi:hypothetical protein LSCM4_04158 [Leishmania orientalis]|uniref:Guanine nucleotide-binding protein subunit beta-like protein n=1 Tax=Leishmania orientalis TaxID=2249476 RepID=A0A836GIA3_9TRYP|nr:hypothetical protein LSCM4_04158 [Leishmania orientalis]
MQGTLFSVNVLRSPFGVRGTHLMSPPDAEGAVANVSTANGAHVSDRYAQVLPRYAPAGSPAGQCYAVSSTRGIQQLVANTRTASLSSPSFLVGAQRADRRGRTTPSPTPRLQVISKHEKGRMLVWNELTGAVVAACLLHPSFTVYHCAITALYLYTTVEGSATTSGAEEEACVYVWDRVTFRSVTVLRGHVSRLTALAVRPTEASTAIATASLDGTVRLWRHQHNPDLSDGAAAGQTEVQLMWVFATAELGNVHALSFLSADTLVAAATRCAVAFLRFADTSAMRRGWSSVACLATTDTIAFQKVKSIVDPHGGTTFLHVCPFNRNSGSAMAAAAASGSVAPTSPTFPSSPRVKSAAAAPSSATVYLLTGSTSGYIQEWAVDVGNTASAEIPQKPAASATAPVYVGIKCRWYHKAHAATVDCVVTDEDVVVSTSLFDRVCLYHRKSGTTCAITGTAAVPVLVPQLKELVWGTIDGELSVASYARFACGTEKQVQLLWTAKPHATAIRGVCLSLTPDLRWDTLCTGAADGSICVWSAESEAGRAAVCRTAYNKQGAALTISRFLHVLPVPPPSIEKGTCGVKRVVALVAGLKAAADDKQCAVFVVELTSTAEVEQITAVPFKSNEEVLCAHLCRGEKGALALWVGTLSGQLLHAAKKPEQRVWTALTPVYWDSKPKGSVTAIASDAASSTIIVAVAEATDANRASQQLFISALRLGPEEAVTMLSLWEGAVVLPSSLGAAKRGERTFTMTWVSKASLDEQGSVSKISGLLLCGNDGTMVRCLRTGTSDAPPLAASWHTPEVLVLASSAEQPYIVQRNIDESRPFLGTAVSAQSRTSDLVCLDVFEHRKRVLVPSSVRTTKLRTLLYDVGTDKVRLAAVRHNNADETSEVSLFDDSGRECGYVTYNGAVVLNSDATGELASEEALSYTPQVQGDTLHEPSVAADTAAPTPHCTAIAAHSGERIIFIGYEDGLLQMVDTTIMYVFCRRWAADATGAARPIADVRYVGYGVVLVRLACNAVCTFIVPPRSLFDQPSLS